MGAGETTTTTTSTTTSTTDAHDDFGIVESNTRVPNDDDPYGEFAEFDGDASYFSDVRAPRRTICSVMHARALSLSLSLSLCRSLSLSPRALSLSSLCLSLSRSVCLPFSVSRHLCLSVCVLTCVHVR